HRQMAHPPRGGAAKPRDSSSQPGYRSGRVRRSFRRSASDQGRSLCMAKLKLWLALALCLASLAAPLTVAPALAAPSDSPAAEMAQVLDLVNAERASNGLSPLTYNENLAESAQGYTQSMADGNFFAHTAPDGSTMVNRAEAAGYDSWTFLAENLAGG